MQRARRSNAGFKLVEMMFAMGIIHVGHGQRAHALCLLGESATSAVSRQLDINNGARVVNFMVKEIKSAQSVAVQTYDGSSFSDIPAGSAQQGNALALTVPSGTNTLQVWYWRNSSGQLYRATLNTGSSKVFLNNVTNTTPFALKNYSGGVHQQPDRAHPRGYQSVRTRRKREGLSSNTESAGCRRTTQLTRTVGRKLYENTELWPRRLRAGDRRHLFSDRHVHAGKRVDLGQEPGKPRAAASGIRQGTIRRRGGH